jgi:superfamily II DNA or RNA helicase
VYQIGQWINWKTKNSECKIVGLNEDWDRMQYELWIPETKVTTRAYENEIEPLSATDNLEKAACQLTYVCNAARIDQLLTSDESKNVIAPARASLRPLPHQIAALKKIMSTSPIRYLLADEVGLGKTIEAGLVIEEMKLRYRIKRILVVVPKGLASQWVSEMHNHFSEEFKLINGNDVETLDRLFVSEGGAWKQFDQVIISQDSIKPLNRRRGWTKEKINAYNQTRLGNLLKASWDLIIIDEAHRLGGSTEQVSRYQLGKLLSDNAPNMLMLTATPHQGKSDAFFRLMNILDRYAFPDADSISRENIAPFLVRTEKRKAIRENGEPLFNKRETILFPVQWGEHQDAHQLLYEQVSEYVRSGYNKALKNKKPHVGFLMILLQRLVSSSTAAIKTTLERRLEVLKDLDSSSEQQLLLPPVEDLELMDGEEQQDALISSSEGVLSEVQTVEELIRLASDSMAESDDPKATAMLQLVSSIMTEEKDYSVKFLIFTEFVPTQAMLRDYLEKRNFEVVLINGSMSQEDRNIALQRFKETASFLISTDAGGEGLNMQFAHIVINYDLPWNPMKIEQRIGRVDRIGQEKPVRAFNLLLDTTVEYRIREVLEEKLETVKRELGVDKTEDVLDSNASNEAYQNALTLSVMNPKRAEDVIRKAVEDIRMNAIEEKKSSKLLSSVSSEPNIEDVQAVLNNPLPGLTEKMVVSYLKSGNGSAERKNGRWLLNWENGSKQKDIVFSSSQEGNFLSTKDEQVSALVKTIPAFHKGKPVPNVLLDGLPEGLSGLWGLYRLVIRNQTPEITKEYLHVEGTKVLYFPVFLSSEGKVFKPTASRIWTMLQNQESIVSEYLNPDKSELAFKQIHQAAISVSNGLIDEYRSSQKILINREKTRLAQYDIYQQDTIDKTGLENVRRFRQQKLGLFNDQIEKEINAFKTIYPELECLIVVSLGRANV